MRFAAAGTSPCPTDVAVSRKASAYEGYDEAVRCVRAARGGVDGLTRLPRANQSQRGRGEPRAGRDLVAATAHLVAPDRRAQPASGDGGKVLGDPRHGVPGP